MKVKVKFAAVSSTWGAQLQFHAYTEVRGHLDALTALAPVNSV